MKHTLMKAKSSQNNKVAHRHRTKLSRAVKRFVHQTDKSTDVIAVSKEKPSTLNDEKECSEKENEIPEGENDIESNEESVKSGTATGCVIKPKKRFTKRPSVALLVDKFESEVRAVRYKVSKVKLHKLGGARSGSFDQEELDQQKVTLTSRSLPPRSKLLTTGSCNSSSGNDREVREIMGEADPSSEDSDELFVPRGFNKSLTILTRKQAQRRKNYRGFIKSEIDTTKIESGVEVPKKVLPDKMVLSSTSSPVILRSEKQRSASERRSYAHSGGERNSYTNSGGERQSYTHSPDNTDASKLLGGKLKAGALASLLKNRKSDHQNDQVSETEGRVERTCSQQYSELQLLTRQRSQSEYRHPGSMVARDKLSLKLSAPSAAFFLNNSTSPLSSSSHPNLSKVLEDASQKETIYESRAASPPLERLFETPLQGFQVVKPGTNLHPREISSTPPSNALTPKPRTPVSSQLHDKLNGLETLVCEMITKLDNVEICTRAQGKRGTVQKRSRNRISLKIKISREQRHIRRQLASVDKKVSAISRRMNLIQRENKKPDVLVSLEEIVSLLNLQDYRPVLERESVTRDDFFLLTKGDLTEMGLPVAVRRRILNYTSH